MTTAYNANSETWRLRSASMKIVYIAEAGFSGSPAKQGQNTVVAEPTDDHRGRFEALLQKAAKGKKSAT